MDRDNNIPKTPQESLFSFQRLFICLMRLQSGKDSFGSNCQSSSQNSPNIKSEHAYLNQLFKEHQSVDFMLEFVQQQTISVPIDFMEEVSDIYPLTGQTQSGVYVLRKEDPRFQASQLAALIVLKNRIEERMRLVSLDYQRSQKLVSLLCRTMTVVGYQSPSYRMLEQIAKKIFERGSSNL